jgi:hypothetical protein
MSDGPQGPGWWEASDLKWYPPERHPNYEAPPPPPPPKLPPPSSWVQPQQPPQPAPARRSAAPWILAGVVAAVVVVLVVAGIAGYLMWPRPHASPTPTAQPSTTPTTAPPVAEGALDGLLLSPDQINTTMGTTGIVDNHYTTAMTDNSARVADQACRPLSGVLIAEAYASSRWSAFREEVLEKPGNNQTYAVDQGVVLFSSAHDAEAFFAASAQQWPACANRQFTVTRSGKDDTVWSVGPLSNTNGILSSTKTQASPPPAIGGWVCEQALTVANNVAIDIEACSGSQSGAAVHIAQQIAANVPR